MNSPNLSWEESINEYEEEEKVTTSLPDHLIFEHILPRLAVKTLLRFKCVCKNWHSYISTPEFSKSQLSLSSYRHQFLLLQKNATGTIVECSNFCLIPDGVEIRGEYALIAIAGCCNGLVCFYPRYRISLLSVAMKFYVLNPATGQQVEIIGPDDECFEDYYYTWFGYVSSTDDYKIIAFNPQGGFFWIFSWSSGIWKRMSCSIDKRGRCTVIKSSCQPVSIDDCLYWPLNRYLAHIFLGTDILKFNLVSEECEVKQGMKFGDARDRGEPARLVNLKGRLAIHVIYCCCISVWKLKHKDDWNSWEKVVDSKKLGSTLVYYSTTGKLLVILDDQLKVVEDPSQNTTASSTRRKQQRGATETSPQIFIYIQRC